MTTAMPTRPTGAATLRRWFDIHNAAGDPKVAQVDIYDEIHWFLGMSSVEFRGDLKALGDVDRIELHINSPGGDVYEAIAIMNTLRQHRARVVTTVDGLAASSAGFIAVGSSDELVMAPNSEIMAHLPWAAVVGDATDLRKRADDLDRVAVNVASIFADRTGGTVDEWQQILADETWWSAEEAVAAGIADKVLANTAARSAATQNRFDLSVFNHAGRAKAPAPTFPQPRNSSPAPVEVHPERKEPIVATLNEGLAELFGLDADADDETILAAAKNALNEPDTGQPDPPAEPTVEQASQIAAKLGMTLVNQSQYDQMVSTVADLSEARDKQVRDENETAIRAALADGRINPATVDTWRAEIAKNREGTLALLATLPANTLPVNEIGHGVSREDQPEDADLAKAFAEITGTSYGKDA